MTPLPPSDDPLGLVLQAGALRLALRPDLGGCIAGLWAGDVPVLRSVEPAALQASRPSGCYPLVPYSNRIAWRRFRWDGQDHQTQPNFDDNPHSVHGVGWLRPWTVVERTAAAARIALHHEPDAHWPYAFDATQTFIVGPGSLEVRMSVTNRAGMTAPVGLGWHPYFPKRERSHLQIALSHRWDSGADQLPTARVEQADIDAPVAALGFDHCFDGWHGAARLGDEAMQVSLTSSLDHLVVFTPTHRPYYCVEPVSHVSNAINLGDPLAHGLRALAPGETTEAWMRLDVARRAGA